MVSLDFGMKKMTAKNISITDTQTIRPRRIFKCQGENKMMARADVWKDHKNQYHCPTCGSVVEDVTNTETGRDCLEIMAL